MASKVMPIRVDATMLSAIEEVADRNNVSVSAAARYLISLGLGKDPQGAVLEQVKWEVYRRLRASISDITDQIGTIIQENLAELAEEE